MDIVASAPGKLVLTGEYAVLEGAPAVVMAVDRRACVTLEPRDAGYCFDAPDIGIAGARCCLVDGDGGLHVQWLDVPHADIERLGLVRTVLEAMAGAAAPPPFRARLDTRAFFATDVTHQKLGLGSSAALTVALSGAIHAHDGGYTPTPADLVHMHRRMQNGHGSGLDIATSLMGGLIVYRLDEGQPQIDPMGWPDGLHLACVWSGRSASTAAYLQRLARWRRRHPAQSAVMMDMLGSAAAAAEQAFRSGRPEAVQQAVSDYALALSNLGEASGIDIVCAEHRRIADIAADCGVAYKICGAGGGDIGVALCADPDRLRAFEERLAQAQIHTLDVTVDRRGLRLH